MNNSVKLVPNDSVCHIRKSLLAFIRDNERPKEIFQDVCPKPQVYFNLTTDKLSNNESWKIVSMRSSCPNNNNNSCNQVNKEIIREINQIVDHNLQKIFRLLPKPNPIEFIMSLKPLVHEVH